MVASTWFGLGESLKWFGLGRIVDREQVEQPGRVGWTSSLMKQLLEGVRVVPLGDAGHRCVTEIHGRSVSERDQGLAPEAVDEFKRVALPLGGQPALSDAELCMAQARRFSRVDRLFHTIETAHFAQQVLAQQRLQSLADVGAATARYRLAQMWGVKVEVPPAPGDLVKDFVSLPEASRPAGSVALDFACDRHGGRLLRFWMSRQAEGDTFGREARQGAWDTDTSGRGGVMVTCTRPRCHRSARLTNEWLVARLREVRADFEAGKGLPIARFSLPQVGLSSR